MTWSKDHTPEVHKDCERAYCSICEGGLMICTACGGAEGSLPTHCPQEPIPQDDQDRIYAGKLDFRNGFWIEASNGGKSSTHADHVESLKENPK
jgi:hypothetical protein